MLPQSVCEADRCSQMFKDSASSGVDAASAEDIRAILGARNESDFLEIVALQPTIRDVEEAATWLSGDRASPVWRALKRHRG